MKTLLRLHSASIKLFNEKWRKFVKNNIIDMDTERSLRRRRIRLRRRSNEPQYGDWSEWNDYYMDSRREKSSYMIIFMTAASTAFLILLVYLVMKF